MNTKFVYAAVMAAFCLSAPFSNANEPVNNYKNNDKRGWHFYEDPEIVEEEEKKPAPKVEAVKPEMVEINAEWLKDNLPKLLNTAIDDPSTENIATYYYAQRLAIDKANAFSDQTKEFFLFE